MNDDTLLVGRSGSVLIVGRKNAKGVVDIVNAFQGDEAEDLYLKLITKSGDFGGSENKD